MNSEKEKLASDSGYLPSYGAAHLAYVRPVSYASDEGYAVCSADGTQLAVFATRDAAFFAAKQHDLEPVLTH